MNRYIISFIILFSFLSGVDSSNPVEEIDETQLRFKVSMATRTESPPIIDGVINDDVWKNAELINDFIQFEPFNLAAPSTQTETRVLYDDDFLYVAFNNFDPDPETIMARVARRDDWQSGFGFNSDWVGIGIDSRNDDKNGYWFAVNAAEVQIDVVISGDGRNAFDNTWDAVWDSKVFHHEKGWSVEFRIPFNIFQFSKEQIQEWGASFQRGYYRTQEEMQWPGRGIGVRGYVPHYGILRGIENIPQPKQLELMPYVLGGETRNGTVERTRNFGLDAQYTLSSNSTMNLTFNPDFGQVEADPSVLNLSAFETRLDERRPFFVESAAFFKSRINLFHSRRIGQRPNYFSPDKGSITERPDNTTILGAAKILGETSAGIRYGLINAVTNEEYGTWEYDEGGQLKREKFLIEPYTNYFIGRVELPVINDISTIGFMATDLRRQNGNASNAFNLDWRLKFQDNKLHFAGQVAHTRSIDKPGNAGRFSVSYRHPVWWDGFIWGGIFDRNFDVNDMGFMRRNNNWDMGIRGNIRRDVPKGIFLKQSLSMRASLMGTGDGLITRKEIDISQENTFMNYWGIGWGVEIRPEVFEDDDLFRDSRAMVYKDEAVQEYEINISTDRRKRIIISPNVKYTHGKVRGWGHSYNLMLMIRPTDYINFSVATHNGDHPSSMQWVGIEEDSVRTHIIYATTEQKMQNINFRLNWAFSPTMTFEAFYQPFKIDMDYVTYNRLVEEKTDKVEPYNYMGDEDFKINNQVGTFVFRWEYSPGSLLYVVYNLNDNRYFSSAEEEWYNTKANSLFVKLNYFFQT
ncbi:MAG: carbohydrate binding family 9 domain-containing protein [Candidatus Marinimicrobia bacterium]|nr:carbohydrate binding family 9 domain-containing protein [Candidatus Neomarinimicrobiota bacterium]MBL7010817.1 carbohydrate binding family 9 domain-containing protein [Candidatus Neomarinimicrobiota bacterium]MBL7031000.1 carbohydrate binding family 9 domain-containing protein [Candidatus Neomarinimicrobiota bacterium]